MLCLEFSTRQMCFSPAQCPDPVDLKSAVGTQWKSSLTCLLSPTLALSSLSFPHVPNTYDFSYSASTILFFLTGSFPEKKGIADSYISVVFTPQVFLCPW